MKDEISLVFINELDQCLCQSTIQEKEFLFRGDDKFAFTTDLEIAFKIKNKIDDVPLWITEFCNNNKLKIRQVLTTYKLIKD